MSRIHQSFSIWSNVRGEGVTLEQVLEAAAEIGYEAVDALGGPPVPELAALTARYGLKIATCGGHTTLTDGLNKPANHERIQAELRASIDQAADLGIPGVITFSGNRNGLDDYRGLLNCAEGLKPVVEYAEAKGINLNMELLNSKQDHKDYQCDRTIWGAVLCELVGSPRVKLLYDIYHMQIDEGDLLRNIREFHRHIGHYHTGGVPGRNDIDESQEIYYPAVMRAILETGYDLYVAHEFIPKGDCIEALRRAYQICNV
ncbi:MAG: TIM barrel protein [Fimbriimonadaceae bacterium]|nr:TIM barrel protein [Fimbriimonadaceae bacterium]